MIGTIGTAPDREVETSAVGQGPWGGNLDVRDIAEGTTCYLNCYHPGGLLYVGDVHASQGDTEFYGTADETRAELTLSCRVIKNKKIPFVRLEKRDSIVSLYSFRPLEDAVESAIINLMEWMVNDYGVSERDAYMHTCINPIFGSTSIRWYGWAASSTPRAPRFPRNTWSPASNLSEGSWCLSFLRDPQDSV